MFAREVYDRVWVQGVTFRQRDDTLRNRRHDNPGIILPCCDDNGARVQRTAYGTIMHLNVHRVATEAAARARVICRSSG